MCTHEHTEVHMVGCVHALVGVANLFKVSVRKVEEEVVF